MAVYFDYKLPGRCADLQTTDVPVQQACWTKDSGSDSLLAIGIDDSLQLFSQEGELLENAEIRPTGGDRAGMSVGKLPAGSKGTTQTHVTYVDWSPGPQKICCAGWRDGHVVFVSANDGGAHILHVGQEPHQGSITCVKFSPQGNVCAVADENGILSLYSIEGTRVHYLHTFRKTGAITNIAFRGKRNSFFFGGAQGVLWHADERNSCTELYKVGSPLVFLEFCAPANKIVLITHGAVLATLEVDNQGKVKNENKLKLSCGKSAAWEREECLRSKGF